MSTGYSGNIGQEIPNDWCYDQYSEISNYNNDFDIDKVIYNEKIEAVDHMDIPEVDVKQLFCKKIEALYYLTQHYADTLNENWSIEKINKYLFNYLRNTPDYTDIIWFGAAGKIDQDYIKFMEDNVTDELKRENIKVPSKLHGTMSVEHLAAIISGMAHWIIFNEEVDALCSWAGDLIQFGAKVQKQSDNNYTFTNDDIYELIGCNNDRFAQDKGFPNANETGFDWEDLEQDIDGINIALKLKNDVKAYTAVSLYYEEEDNYKNRIDTMLVRYFGILPTQEKALANIAESYTNLSKATALALAIKQGGYDVDTLSPKLSSQFARKIIDMYNQEINA